MSAAARRARFLSQAPPPAATARSICATRSRQGRLWLQQSRKAGARSFSIIFSQPITEAADGFNRVAGFAEFFAQAAHVRIHCACVDDAFVAPDFIQQPIAVLYAAPALHQFLQ